MTEPCWRCKGYLPTARNARVLHENKCKRAKPEDRELYRETGSWFKPKQAKLKQPKKENTNMASHATKEGRVTVARLVVTALMLDVKWIRHFADLPIPLLEEMMKNLGLEILHTGGTPNEELFDYSRRIVRCQEHIQTLRMADQMAQEDDPGVDAAHEEELEGFTYTTDKVTGKINITCDSCRKVFTKESAASWHQSRCVDNPENEAALAKAPKCTCSDPDDVDKNCPVHKGHKHR